MTFHTQKVLFSAYAPTKIYMSTYICVCVFLTGTFFFLLFKLQIFIILFIF